MMWAPTLKIETTAALVDRMRNVALFLLSTNCVMRGAVGLHQTPISSFKFLTTQILMLDSWRQPTSSSVMQATHKPY